MYVVRGIKTTEFQVLFPSTSPSSHSCSTGSTSGDHSTSECVTALNCISVKGNRSVQDQAFS